MADKIIRVPEAGTFVLYSDTNDPGFVRTVNGEAWLWRALPDAYPMFDALSPADRDKAAAPILTIMDRLARLVPTGGMDYRRLVRNTYRNLKILSISTPVRFKPADNLPPEMRARLAADHAGRAVEDRVALAGVKLRTGGGRRKGNWLLNQIIDMGYYARYGVEPDSSFDTDRAVIDACFRAAGAAMPTPAQMQRGMAWWQTSRRPDICPAMVEPGHLHIFPSWERCAVAEKYHATGVPCETWMQRDAMGGAYTMSIVSLGPLDFEGVDGSSDPNAIWASRLLADRGAGGGGALCVMVSGAVEPGVMTARQLRRDQDKMMAAVERRFKDQSAQDQSKVDIAGNLRQMASMYESDGRQAPPTLIDGTVMVAVDGMIDHNMAIDDQVNYPGFVKFNPLRQEAAFQTMQIGSNVEYSPSRVYWPAPFFAYAGLAGTARSGEGTGALLGFTESARQPVYVDPRAVERAETYPIMTILGASGSGKTVLADHLAVQWAQLVPGLVVDPKQQSDFSDFFKAYGAKIVRLDDPNLADGILDSVRCMGSREGVYDDMINTTTEMIHGLLVADGDDKIRQTDLMASLKWGIAHGADCTGEALAIAERDRASGADVENGRHMVPETIGVIRRTLDYWADTQTMFRIIYGRQHGGLALKSERGLTLLMAGDLNLVPTAGSNSFPDTLKRWIVRMMAMGGAASMMGRSGFVFIDEAWILLGDEAGARIAERFGRLGRLQRYTPVFASQRVREFLDAQLQSYVSRGIILSMSGRGDDSDDTESEAAAALKLFGLPIGSTMHRRMTAPATLGAVAGDQSKARPNWMSLKALKDPETGEVIRGSVAYYIGLDNTAIPVEVTIPSSTLALLP